MLGAAEGGGIPGTQRPKEGTAAGKLHTLQGCEGLWQETETPPTGNPGKRSLEGDRGRKGLWEPKSCLVI